MPFLGKVPSQIVDSDVDIDGGTIDGATIGSITAGAGTFTNLSATGTITFPDDGISGDDINGGTISNFTSTGIDDNATSTAITIDASQNVGINEIAPDVRLHVKGGNSGATGNSAGQVFVEGNTSAGISIGSATTNSSYVWFGDSDNIAQGRIRYDNLADKFEFRANNVDDILVLGSVEAVFNEESNNQDFRVESDSSTHALFVDATNGNIGINDSAPSSTLASGVSATGRVLSIASGGTTAISIRSTDAVNDRNAVLEMLSSGNGGSNNIIVYGDTDTTPSSKSGLIFQGYHNGSRVQRAELDWSGQWKNEIGAIFNESGADSDFRVESDTNTHALFVDAGHNQVVVGTSAPITGVGAVMTLGGGSHTRLAIDGTDSAGLYLTDSGAQGITIRNASGDLEFYGVATREFVFNEDSVDADFRVESDSNAHALFVDAGNSRVGINNSSPNAALTVTGAIRQHGEDNGGALYQLTDNRVYTATQASTNIFQLAGLNNGACEITILYSDYNYRNGSFIQKLYVACTGSGSTVLDPVLTVENKARSANGTFPNYLTWTATASGSNLIFSCTADTNLSGNAIISIRVDSAASVTNIDIL